jgi:hypothetical protein
MSTKMSSAEKVEKDSIDGGNVFCGSDEEIAGVWKEWLDDQPEFLQRAVARSGLSLIGKYALKAAPERAPFLRIIDISYHEVSGPEDIHFHLELALVTSETNTLIAFVEATPDMLVEYPYSADTPPPEHEVEAERELVRSALEIVEAVSRSIEVGMGAPGLRSETVGGEDILMTSIDSKTLLGIDTPLPAECTNWMGCSCSMCGPDTGDEDECIAEMEDGEDGEDGEGDGEGERDDEESDEEEEKVVVERMTFAVRATSPRKREIYKNGLISGTGWSGLYGKDKDEVWH